MERVLFDVEAAPELVTVLRRAGGDVEDRRATVRRLLSDAGEEPGSVDRLLGEVSAWSLAVADDLRWRLEYLEQCQPGLPNARSATTADGRREGMLPFADEQEARRWQLGTMVHQFLYDAFDDNHPDGVEQMLDRLEGLADDPIALAGFASMLGPNGLAGIVDRIDRARDEDDVDSLAEVVAGGINERWDDVHARLAEVATGLGGLLTYVPDAPVAVPVADGGFVVVTMHDLLVNDPAGIAGRWAADRDLADTDFVALGGQVVRVVPLGARVSPSGVVLPGLLAEGGGVGLDGVARELWTPGLEASGQVLAGPHVLDGVADSFWVNAVDWGATGLTDGYLRQEVLPTPFRPKYHLPPPHPEVGIKGWLPTDATTVGRFADRWLDPVDRFIDYGDLGLDAVAAWSASEGQAGHDRLLEVGRTVGDGAADLYVQGIAAKTVGAAAGGACAAFVVTAPAAPACAVAGGIAGGWAGSKVYNTGKGLVGLYADRFGWGK